jgi:hypothetical protein
MTDEYNDPSANTAQFQAFVHRPEEAAPVKARPIGLIIGGVVAVVVVIAVVAYFLAR